MCHYLLFLVYNIVMQHSWHLQEIRLGPIGVEYHMLVSQVFQRTWLPIPLADRPRTRSANLGLADW